MTYAAISEKDQTSSIFPVEQRILNTHFQILKNYIIMIVLLIWGCPEEKMRKEITVDDG